jgi:RNA polymerase sigma factor (sigma-70 family)
MAVRSDEDLVLEARARGATAYGVLVERHQRRVFGVAYALLADRALAEDVAQEAFLAGWRQLADLEQPAQVGAWLVGIARNLARGTLRRQGRAPLVDEAEPVPTPHDQTVAAEDEALLARALGQVAEGYREALVLYYLEDRSIRQVAQALALGEAVVRQRLARGRKALRRAAGAVAERSLARTGPRRGLAAAVVAAIVASGARQAAAGAAGKATVAAMTTKQAILILGPLLALAGGAVLLGRPRAPAQARPAHTADASATTAGRTSGAPSGATARGGSGGGEAETAAGRARRIDRETYARLQRDIAIAQARRAGGEPASPGGDGELREVAEPPISKAQIQGAVREILPLLEECYQQAQASRPELGGQVLVGFDLLGDEDVGTVVGGSEILDADPGIDDDSFRECVRETMYAMQIDVPMTGTIHVEYGFGFRPDE